MEAANETSKVFVETFLVTFCHLLDFPRDGVDCSVNDPNKCVKCMAHSTFIAGGNVSNFNHSAALTVYSVIWSLTMLIGFLGILSNTVIIMVVKRRKEHKSFDILLSVLAGVDIFCCIAAIFSSTGIIAYFGNWLDRGEGSVYWYWMTALGLLGRSGSAFTTVIITIERFLVISFPFQAKSWLTPRKTKIMTSSMIFFALFLNYPRFAGFSVQPNNLHDIPSLQTAPYLLRLNSQGRFWFITMACILDQIDFWTPLPIILLFNLLTYWKVREFSKHRKELNPGKNLDIRTTQMFLPVILVYFITKTTQLLSYTLIDLTNVDYRELYILLFLSTAANSAVNMPIYYFRCNGFKAETQLVVPELLDNMGLGEVSKWRSSIQQHFRSSILGTNELVESGV